MSRGGKYIKGTINKKRLLTGLMITSILASSSNIGLSKATEKEEFQEVNNTEDSLGKISYEGNILDTSIESIVEDANKDDTKEKVSSETNGEEDTSVSDYDENEVVITKYTDSGEDNKILEQEFNVQESLDNAKDTDLTYESFSESKIQVAGEEAGVQPRMMMAMPSIPSYGITTNVSETRLTTEPVGITVAGGNKESVQSIEMVSSPEKGRNYAKYRGDAVYRLSSYGSNFALHNYQELMGKEITVSFDIKTEDVGMKSVLNTVISGGISYNLESKVTDTYRRVSYTVPANDEINEFEDYSFITLKRGNDDTALLIKDLKVELGSTATPYTKAPEDENLYDVVNLFDKDDWLETSPEEKPLTTGVPYMDIPLEPNSLYTVSTDIGRRDDMYYDVFMLNTGDFASSSRNGAGIGYPHVMRTNPDGIGRLATRRYDSNLRDGSKYIMINKGDKPLPLDSKAKTYNVSSNGDYTFRVTYKDGSTKDTTVNVNNFVSVSGVPYQWSSANVQLMLDMTGGNPVKVSRIQLPNKQWVNGGSASYRVTDNGTYTFVAEDTDGNTIQENVVIDKIDRGLPTINANHEPKSWTSQAVDINVTAYDAESGIEKVEMTGRPSEVQDGGENLFLNSNFEYGKSNWGYNEITGIFEVEDNTLSASGEGRFFYSIVALPIGETYTISFDARKEGDPDDVYLGQGDGTSTIGEAEVNNEWERYTMTFTSINKYTVSFHMRDTESIYQFRNMKLEKGDTATPWIPAVGDGVGSGGSVFPVVNNGEYTFTATDYAGNKKEVVHEVNNIDSTPPSITITKNISGFTKGGSLELTYSVKDEQSGVEEITLPDGKVVTGISTGKFKVTENGKYRFKVEDKVGNTYTHTEEITQFDREAPKVTVTGNPADWSDKDLLTLNLKAVDTGSGVKQITLPDKTVVSKDTASYKVSKNGTYTFIVEDNVGNKVVHTETVNKLMISYKFYVSGSDGKPLEGAGFDLYRDGVKYTYTESDTTGLVDFGKVPTTGKYSVKQVKAPDGHVIDPNEKDVDVDDNTDPEEFVSYPRGEILPATGTSDTAKVVVLIAILSSIIGVISYHNRGNRKK